MSEVTVPFHLLASRVWAIAAQVGTVSSFTAHAPTAGRRHGLISLRAKTPADAENIARALGLGDIERTPDTDKASHRFDGYTITVRAFRRIPQGVRS